MRKIIKCDACNKQAVYEHPHFIGVSEYACADHWGNCDKCKQISGHIDKYQKKKVSK